MVVAGSQERALGVLEAGAVSGKVWYWRCGFEVVGRKVAELVHEQVGGHRARVASVWTSASQAQSDGIEQTGHVVPSLLSLLN